MRLALRLARKGYGATSPNPMVGAVLVKRGEIIGRGWHRRAGQPHAEIEALRDARRRGVNPRGAILYVTLEPCSTYGRTPPCTEAILAAGIKQVVVGATDPNPRHTGRAFTLLKRRGVSVTGGILAQECTRLNEAFNHWIVRGIPFVTVKAAMTLDGKIASASGESKWITAQRARAFGMKLRQAADAILVGINTILADDPELTVRPAQVRSLKPPAKPLRRIVLDSFARTPFDAKIIRDGKATLTTIVVSEAAPLKRVQALAKRVNVVVAPSAVPTRAGHEARINLVWLLKRLGSDGVTNLLVEGGGETNASFLLERQADRIAFFYAPKILGGLESRKAVAGNGARSWEEIVKLETVKWQRLGPDWVLTARCSAYSQEQVGSQIQPADAQNAPGRG
jgi:diaminohydroxyphosphoribosylaminopyrimidine deaminase / 5-amino-6-(5-phosphoribosylamino)uracil reductase